MAYDKQKLYKQALEEIEKNKLYFIEDLVAFLPCSKPTFYDHFPVDSNEFNAIKDRLEHFKVQTKVELRKKLMDGRGSELIALYKLLSTEEEAHKLNGTKQEIKHDGSVNIIELGSGKKPE